MAPRSISGKRLAVVLVAVFVLGSALIAFLLLRSPAAPTPPRTPLAVLSPDSTATAGFAGMIPSAEESALPRPLGLDGDGERLYVALADLSAIGVFTYEGVSEETISVSAAQGAAVSTPVDLAIFSDGNLGIVDTAGSRVLIVDPGDPKARGVEFGGGSGKSRIVSPTAIDAQDGLVYIADSSDGSVREYEESGKLLRTMSFEAPNPTFVGALCVAGETLWVSDSNADRVIAVDLATGAQSGILERRLGLPRGVAVTKGGRIMVAETFGRRISVFDPTGASVVDVFPDALTEGVANDGLLEAPESLVWDEAGARLYVTDVNVGRIKVYNYRVEE